MKNILSKHLLFTRRSSPNTSQSGFSLIELMVVTVMIGVLSTIAAAGWEAFTTRQRIRTVNDQVFQALRSAQSDAKLKKETRAVAFDIESTTFTPQEIKIYQKEVSTTANPNIPIIKKIDLTNNGEIKKGQVKMSIKANGVDNGTPFSLDTSGNNLGKRYSIKFNYLGSVEDTTITSLPFQITTSTPQDGMKRCIIVETLLGGMRSAQGSECP